MFSDLEKHELAEAAASRHESRFRFVTRFLKNWVLERLASSAHVPSWRVVLHRWRGVQMGRNVYVGYGVIFDRVYPEQITIGDDAVIGDRCKRITSRLPYHSPWSVVKTPMGGMGDGIRF